MQYFNAFLIGGIICSIGQLLIDKTKLTPARILVIFVVSGVILTAIGVYEPLVNFAGAGATVPLSGFGYSLAKGVVKEVQEIGVLGIFTGGIKATAAGIAAAIIFGYIASIISKPQIKE
ncbi:MAG: stage V sporulation protein AE [Clostridiales bacterium]|nr:stage V sporulation protein AE [Clostridiales bacterium]